LVAATVIYTNLNPRKKMEKNSNDKKTGHGMLIPTLFVITAIVVLILIKLIIS
jgi:hypothetical protein